VIVQYTSDLHLESSYDSIRPSDISGDILILAGDIDESGPKNFSKAVDFFHGLETQKPGFLLSLLWEIMIIFLKIYRTQE
jgi:hypothetical protein